MFCEEKWEQDSANGTDIATIEGSGAISKIYYNHSDSLNSSAVMTDSTGAIAETIDYFPFGSLRFDNKVSTFSEQRKYIGQEYDQDTGLNYLNARYYNSNIGRFISEDPMFWNFDQAWLADPQNQNSYAYARNNPLIYSDPDGKKAELVVKSLAPIPGAHGFIRITPESGVNLSKYGDSSHYTIGGYPSKVFGGTLQAKINEPGDLNLSNSRQLASYPLSVPEGMSVAQYDQRLLESGSKLTKGNLGNYTFTGEPISKNSNSGNTAAQVVADAGGNFPKINNVYIGSSPLPGVLHKLPYPYFPLGLGNPIGTPSYGERAATAVNNAINSVKSVVISNVSSAVDAVKSKLYK